jgi:hypothetical protein
MINQFTGSRKTTCKEAMRLLNQGKVFKAWFRPNGIVSKTDPDKDLALVWDSENGNGKHKE